MNSDPKNLELQRRRRKLYPACNTKKIIMKITETGRYTASSIENPPNQILLLRSHKQVGTQQEKLPNNRICKREQIQTNYNYNALDGFI
jgi:hypothetical protein